MAPGGTIVAPGNAINGNSTPHRRHPLIMTLNFEGHPTLLDIGRDLKASLHEVRHATRKSAWPLPLGYWGDTEGVDTELGDVDRLAREGALLRID